MSGARACGCPKDGHTKGQRVIVMRQLRQRGFEANGHQRSATEIFVQAPDRAVVGNRRGQAAGLRARVRACTLTYPQAGVNPSLTRILVGMFDYGTGLDQDSFHVAADFALDGVAAGENLARKFRPKSDGVWELVLTQPPASLAKGRFTVSVRDRQGNTSRIDRTFSVGKE